MTAQPFQPGQRITGEQRTTLARDLAKHYDGGASIRTLAAGTGRSYGAVHRLLVEAGVTFRQRGGARRRASPRGAQRSRG